MMIDTTEEQTILCNLNIAYRQCNFADSSLFFCELPDGLTFDLQVDRNKLSLWRIVEENRGEKNNEVCICFPFPGRPKGFIIFRVTNEGDLMVQYDFYHINECRNEEIAQVIRYFSQFIRVLDSRLN